MSASPSCTPVDAARSQSTFWDMRAIHRSERASSPCVLSTAVGICKTARYCVVLMHQSLPLPLSSLLTLNETSVLVGEKHLDVFCHEESFFQL